ESDRGAAVTEENQHGDWPVDFPLVHRRIGRQTLVILFIWQRILRLGGSFQTDGRRRQRRRLVQSRWRHSRMGNFGTALFHSPLSVRPTNLAWKCAHCVTTFCWCDFRRSVRNRANASSVPTTTATEAMAVR